MQSIALFYATREGQTARVAEHVAGAFRSHGFEVDVRNVKEIQSTDDLGDYAAAVLAASVHFGRHEKEMVQFVKERRVWLKRMPTTFLSISGTEASAEDPTVSEEKRAQSAGLARKTIDSFVKETDWQPTHCVPVAGAIRYSQYNFLLRPVMRQIARSSGSTVDVSQDHEYTDWATLDLLVQELSNEAAPDLSVR